jgi:hypothetical protein
MKVHFGDVSVDVRFSQDDSGNWHFEYEIPNYRGSGETMRIASDMEFESEHRAKEHAESAVKADLERNRAEIEERSR